MNELRTVRERVQRASRYFSGLDGVVLTTFNLNAEFLENYALPAALGVEAKTPAGRRAELHQRLGATPCTVYYDPVFQPNISGRYRYVSRPMPVRGRFFHPKLVVLAGRTVNGTTCAYLAVCSANLTRSGWGHNAESFGETWICTSRQQPWKALDGLLEWIGCQSPLRERCGDADAISRIRATLARMPESVHLADDSSEPWSGTLPADLYVSVVHKAGLAAFLRGDLSTRPSELRAYGPYWSDLSGQLAAFDAHKTVLVPALRMDRRVLGLSRGQFAQLGEGVEIRRNEEDAGDRFWHMKAYWIRHEDRIRTAVGSCNFTQAGLSGGNGNVEVMLVFDADPSWLPQGTEVQFDRLAEETQAEEGTAEPVPLAVVVAWDWFSHAWRWWLESDSGQSDFKLHLPDITPFPIKSGTGGPKAGKAPARGTTFRVSYRTTRGEGEWQGQVVELNLDYSSRTYGPPITANDILESWRGLAPTWDLGGSGGDGDPSNDPDEIGGHKPAAFEALNLFEFYRSAKALGAKLQGLRKNPEMLRGYLVGRSDSVMALAHLADREEVAPVVRFLVLRELYGVVSKWTDIVDKELVDRVEQMEKRARKRTLDQLTHEMGGDEQQAGFVLDWFEKELAGLDRRMSA